MVWLLFVPVVLLFTHFGVKRNNSKVHIVFRLLLLIILSLMTGLGSKAGTDHDTYVELFYSLTSWNQLTGLDTILTSYAIEPGYMALNIIAHTLHISEALFFVLVAILMNLAVVCLVYRFERPVIAVLVYVLSISYLQEINLVRQCIAVSFFAISIYYLEQRKFIKHFALLILAASMHSTALLCIPFSVLGFINLDKYRDQITVIFMSLWFFSLLVQLQLISLPSFNMGGFEDTRYENYADGSHGTGNELGFNYMYNLLFIFVIMSIRTRINIYKVLIMFGVVLINLNIDVAIRFALYFLIFIPIMSGDFLTLKSYNKTPQLFQIVNGFKIIFVLYWGFVYFRSYIFGSPILGSTFYQFDL